MAYYVHDIQPPNYHGTYAFVFHAYIVCNFTKLLYLEIFPTCITFIINIQYNEGKRTELLQLWQRASILCNSAL